MKDRPDCWLVLNEDEFPVASCSQKRRAEEIVRAVNCHTDLLTALEDVAAACEGRSLVPVTDFLPAVLAAIALARGESP